MKKPNIKKMTKAIDDFNSKYKVGDTIKYLNDSGIVCEDIITDKATILGGHTPVMWLTKARCYDLSRVYK
jgi:hypothetical protein